MVKENVTWYRQHYEWPADKEVFFCPSCKCKLSKCFDYFYTYGLEDDIAGSDWCCVSCAVERGYLW